MILVCGEALMDVYGGAVTPTGQQLDARIGGSPLNVAIGLARLGQPTAFFGGIADDFLGDRLLRAVADESVDTRAICRLPARTTLSLVGVDARGVPAYAFYGEGGADRLLPTEALRALPSGLRAVHLGSYTVVVEPVASTLRALVRGLDAGVFLAYDPNVRANVQPELLRWRQAIDALLPRLQLLKISDEDFERLYPGQDPDATARRWIAAGAEAVVLTRGAQGARAWTAHAVAEVPGVPVAVVDTVGAGDTFQAALLTWLAETGRLEPGGLARAGAEDLRQALAFAARAAAITCSRRGADLPRRAELPAA